MTLRHRNSTRVTAFCRVQGSRTLETLRAFQRDCRLATAGLAVGWLLVQDVTSEGQFNWNSNVVLVALIGWFGWQLHQRLYAMRLGPHAALTPGLERSTMLACCVLVGSVALVGAVFCWWSGNRIPALGPCVLVGAVTLTGLHQIRAARIVKWPLQFGALGVVVLAVAEDELLQTVAKYAKWLSDPRLQIGSLVVAASACTLRKPVRNRAFLPPLMVPTWSERPLHSVRDVLGRLRSTAGAMRVFRPDGKFVVAAVGGSFLLAHLFTAFGFHPANANIVVLWLLATVGGIVGHRISQACVFHGFLLVEGFARSVMLTSYGLVAIASVVGAALSLTVGNAIPPIAPGVFIALVMIRHHRFTQPLTAFGAIFMFGTFMWWDSELERLTEFTSALSHPWMQFAAGVAAVPVVRYLQTGFRLPVLLDSRAAVTSEAISLRQTVLRNVTWSAGGLVGFLLFALFLWVLHPDLPGFVYRLIALGWPLLMLIAVTTESDIESRMARDWLLGVTDSRLALGRRCIAVDVVSIISWIPVGMVGVAIHATLLDVQGDSLLMILLLGLIAGFAMIALRGWTLGRLSDGWQTGIELLAVHLLLAGVFVLDMAEYGASDYGLLVSVTLMAGALAVEVGGRGLAKAKILNSPVD